MGWSALRFAAITALGVWFTLVVPAHQRGQIRLPGADLVSRSCCEHKPAAGCHGQRGGGESDDGKDPVRQCAVCHLVAKLTTPEPLIFSLPDPDLLVEAVFVLPDGRQLDVPLDARRSRGPPANL